MRSLAEQLSPCGPVVDDKAAGRAREVVAETVWTERLDCAWPALAPIFGAAPYLASLARRDPARLDGLLAAEPQAQLEDILVGNVAAADLDLAAARVALRHL